MPHREKKERGSQIEYSAAVGEGWFRARVDSGDDGGRRV